MPTMSNEERYQAASDLFHVDPKMCVAAARKNLGVLYISPYYIIENAMLIACAEDDWSEGEYWRLFAEEMHKKTVFQAKRQNNKGLLEVLAVVREELDEVEQQLIDSVNDMADAESDEVVEEEDEDEEEDEEENKEQAKEVSEDKRKKEKKKADNGAVTANYKDTLKAPLALPLRSKRVAANDD